MTTRKGVSSQSWIALLFLWLIFAMNANGRELTNRLLPSIIDEFKISPEQAGWIGSIAALGMFLASFPLARWADGKGRGWSRKYRMAVFSLGYLVFMIFNGITPFTTAFSMVLIFQFCRGICSGPGEACEVGAVAEWWPKEKNGFALGFHHAAYPWGSAIGGVIVSIILYTFGSENWRYCFIFFGVLGFIIFFLFWRWSNKENYSKFQNHTIEAGMTPPVSKEQLQQAKNIKEKGVLIRTLKNPNIMVIGLVCLLCQFAYIALLFWMTPYLTFCAGYSPAAVSSLTVIYAISGGLGQIIWGSIADRCGPKKIMMICCAWLTVAYFIMQYININIYLLVGLQLLLGCCSNAVYPLMYKFVADSSESGNVVTGNGILTTCMFCGATIAPTVTGYFINLGGGWESTSGYMTGIYTMVGAMIIAFLLITLFTRETCGPNYGKDFALVSLKACNLAK